MAANLKPYQPTGLMRCEECGYVPRDADEVTRQSALLRHLKREHPENAPLDMNKPLGWGPVAIRDKALGRRTRRVAR